MKPHLLRNISWIALIAVWSFLAGAYAHLGWVRDASMSYQEGFFLGGLAMWIVFTGVGILIYRMAKKEGNEDAAKPALYVLSFFTVVFLLIAWVKYDDVKKDKFVDDMEYSFVRYYEWKAQKMGIRIIDLDSELEKIYMGIEHDLLRHPELEKLMELTTEEAVFEDNTVITELCLNIIKMYGEIGYPPPAGMEELFE